ncbi:MAG: 50S ribosomal protein L10 [Patescibacteria group bacterium]|nr:50S ribosomal protein L10 [Patescibacteria group bacterium]
MAKTKEQKKQIIKDLVDKISKAKSIIFVRFAGLAVKDNEELRNMLRSEQSEYYVAKKTLMDLAFKEAGVKEIKAKEFEGQIAAVFGYEDEVAPAKIIDKFSKGLEDKIKFIQGILDNKFIKASEVAELAKLPNKQELYAKIVGSINAPVSGFVGVLAGNLRNLVYVLKAIENKK